MAKTVKWISQSFTNFCR